MCFELFSQVRDVAHGPLVWWMYWRTCIYIIWMLSMTPVSLFQLAGLGGQWGGGIHWPPGGGVYHAGHDPWRPLGQGHPVLFHLHTLWDPPCYDPRSVCLHYSFPWSQPGNSWRPSVTHLHIEFVNQLKLISCKRKAYQTWKYCLIQIIP